ncbi:hypothetical protein EZS27_003434 [termite gut metagenome]|jgi:hypothetical protein|uniref:Uncharacterized protein n=1 Tax=termite gut metagenome TaxID=433724 RepID=A0A5J4SUG3_9ZZZZ
MDTMNSKIVRNMNLETDLIKQLLKDERVTGSGNLYSTEFSQNFKVENSTLYIDKSSKAKGKLRLCVNNINIYKWFRVKSKNF